MLVFLRMIGRINSDKAQAYADRKRAAMNRAKKLREDRHALDSTFGTSEGTMGMCWEKGKERTSPQKIRSMITKSTGSEVISIQTNSIGERIRIQPTFFEGGTKIMDAWERSGMRMRGFASEFENSSGWSLAPPWNPEGSLFQISNRPIMCSAMRLHEVVFGCSDHALYALDLDQPTQRPIKMHGNHFGHADWVTSVTFNGHGSIVSGGMDGRLCFWSQDKRQCNTATHHTRSISDISCADGDIVISGSYDCSACVWNTSHTSTNSASPVAVLLGHKSPIIVVESSRDTVAAGGKDGGLLVWDIETCQTLARVRGHRDAPCSTIKMSFDSKCMITAGGDGKVKLWDPREKRLVSEVGFVSTGCHDNPTPVVCADFVGDQCVAAGGANGVVHIYDLRCASNASAKSARLRPKFQFFDCVGGIYSMTTACDTSLLVGDGRGMLLCYDLISGRLAYGMGASEAGPLKSIMSIRTLRKVITAGEDGNALVYSYN